VIQVFWTTLSFVLASGIALAQTPPAGQTASPVLRPQGSVNLLEGIIEDYSYIPGDKRDPFQPFNEAATLSKVVVSPNLEPMLPLERFDLDQLKLVGIIWGGDKSRAMFLDPESRTHIVRLNERLGKNRGYIAAIREGEVVVMEPFGKEGSITYRTLILKLQRAEAGK
jgi:type IV pilus assembly protein PilP